MRAAQIEIDTLIDETPLGLYRILIVAVCCAVAMVDGFDTQSIAFVAPEIAAGWNVPVAQFGPVFGIGLFGGLVGAVILGAAGDRYGRKIVLLFSIAIFAIVSLATTQAGSIAGLLVFRFLTGFGLGGAIPGIIAITSEYSPQRRRATLVTLMFCGFPLGAVLGGAVSAKLIPAYGWPSVFYLGGVIPLVLLPLVQICVPESIRLLLSRPGASAEIARVLRRIHPQASIPDEAQFVASERRTEGVAMRHLFTEGRAAGTFLLWTTFFMSLLLSFFLINWMPVVLRQLGFPIATAVIATVMLNAGGILGSFLQARLIDRFGPLRVIAPAYAIGAVFVMLIGFAPAQLALTLAIVFLAGFFSIGAQLSVVSLAAIFYPTLVRATGIGWCMGIGRVGAIAGPVIGGALIAIGFGIGGLFLAAAAASIVASAAIFTMALKKTGGDLGALAKTSIGGVVLSALLLAGGSSHAQVTQGLVLSGVTIVDTHDGKLTRDMAVVIDGGKITKIAPARSLKTSGSARRIDAHGKFVVPGYLDMHVHSMMSNDTQGSLDLMLANGITGFRQMSGTPELLQQRKDGKTLSPTAAPELLAMPGTILTGLNAGSPEAAVAEVDKQKALGADFIKVIDVKPPAFFAALDEATKLGLPFAGHLPPAVDVVQASKKGMRSIEHLGPKESVLLGCSTDEAAMRQEIAQNPPKAPPIVPGPVLASLAARALANPIMATDPLDFKLMGRVIATYSEAKCRKLAALFIADGTWQVPTLIRLRTMEFGDDPRYRNDPNLRYIPRATRALWEELAQQFPSKISPETRHMLTRFFVLQLKLTKLYETTGVKMLAGSDSGGNNGHWDISGFALHQEFDLLAQAGLSPLHILQMTTLNGATFLGREDNMGSVEVGKDANLVLLDANPVASARNLHRIDAVVRGGEFYSRKALNDLMERTRDRQAAAGG